LTDGNINGALLGVLRWTDHEAALVFNPPEEDKYTTLKIVDLSKGLSEKKAQVDVASQGDRALNIKKDGVNYICEAFYDANGEKN